MTKTYLAWEIALMAKMKIMGRCVGSVNHLLLLNDSHDKASRLFL